MVFVMSDAKQYKTILKREINNLVSEISSYLKLGRKIEEPIDGLLNRNFSTLDKVLLTCKDQNKKKRVKANRKRLEEFMENYTRLIKRMQCDIAIDVPRVLNAAAVESLDNMAMRSS